MKLKYFPYVAETGELFVSNNLVKAVHYKMRRQFKRELGRWFKLNFNIKATCISNFDRW